MSDPEANDASSMTSFFVIFFGICRTERTRLRVAASNALAVAHRQEGVSNCWGNSWRWQSSNPRGYAAFL